MSRQNLHASTQMYLSTSSVQERYAPSPRPGKDVNGTQTKDQQSTETSKEDLENKSPISTGNFGDRARKPLLKENASAAPGPVK